MTVLTTSSQNSNPQDEYFPSSDSAELRRVQQAYGSLGLGDSLYDDQTNPEEVAEMLGPFGYAPKGD